MILSKNTLLSKLQTNELLIDPLLDPDEQIQGSKIDLRLDNVFMLLEAQQTPYYDPQEKPNAYGLEESFQRIEIGFEDHFFLHPGSFILGQTLEFIRVPPSCVGRIEGRSSLARRGILVHITASMIDPGYCGYICLELFNVGKVPVRLSPLMRIAALTVEELDGEAPEYQGKFGSDLRSIDMNQRDSDSEILRITRARL